MLEYSICISCIDAHPIRTHFHTYLMVFRVECYQLLPNFVLQTQVYEQQINNFVTTGTSMPVVLDAAMVFAPLWPANQ
jgi:hypothetical protein